MRITARRKQGGEPLRAAMAEAGIGLEELARRTRLADPDNKGRSFQLLGFLTQDAAASRHARETCDPGTARLVEDALNMPRESLFELVKAPGRAGEIPEAPSAHPPAVKFVEPAAG